MKLKWILVTTILAYSSLSQAEFVFNLSSGSCASIAGHWSGKGKVSSWILGECSYHGDGQVNPVDDAGRFTVDVIANKESGPSICPKQANQKLSASCKDGVVTIKTDFGSIKGEFSNNSGSASGTLSVSPGLEADVTMTCSRMD